MKKFLIVSVAALALAACHREGPSDENSVNIVADNAYENVMPDESTAPLDNAMNAANVAEAPAPPPVTSDQAQMQDDADATGMTSRTDRDASAGDTSGNSTDAVQVERK
jgi:hypothetical protein